MPLPRKVGPFTLMRKLATDAVAESFVAILDAPAGKQVIVLRLLPAITRDPARLHALRTRVGDLRALRPHPGLAGVLGMHDLDGDTWVVEEQPDGIELSSLLASAAARGVPIPHNVYLHLAAQLCNALEALHANPGIETGSEHVLHQALGPSTLWVTADGRLTLGRYGLTRSPTAIATQSTGAMPAAVEYLSPEQTHQDQKLTPASDLFSLGAVLYELLTFKSLFRAESNLQTIHRLRRAEVTTQLLEVKEILPGLDKVLFRSLSLNARHRYQRAFVLREDLRGLMAGYSFADIEPATRRFLEPTIAAAPTVASSVDGSALGREFHTGAARERTADLLRGIPDDALRDSPMSEPREHGPADAPSGEDLFGPEGDGSLGDDTAALLGGDTATLPRPSEPREDTGWLPDARRSLAEGQDPISRPLEPIDTARRTRDALDAPSVPPRMGLLDLEPFGPDAHGDTLPMQLETTRPSPDDGDTGPSWPPLRVPGTGPTSLPPEPPHRARAAPPPTEPRPTTAPLPAPVETRSDPPTGPLLPPSDFAASLADDADLHPLRASSASAVPDLRPPPPPTPPAPRPASPPPVRSAPAALPVDAVSLEADHGPDAEPRRSLLVPALGLVAVALAAGAAVFVCVGGGGILGLLGMRRGSDEVVAISRPVEPPPLVATVAAPAPPPPEVPAPTGALPPPPPPVTAPPPEPRAATPRQRELGLDLAPPKPAPARETFEAVSAAPRPAPVRPPPPPPPPPAPSPEAAPPVAAPAVVVAGSAELDAWSASAFAGTLDADHRGALGRVPPDDGEFTRAQTLLLLDAKARGDRPARDRAMTTLMAVPENRYNPALLVEQAEIAVEERDWAVALEAARKAEQHWARLPSELVWSRKALMYELQALANTGRFYDSEGEDLSALQAAIRDWERYQRHVATKQRSDLAARADANLARLREIQSRLEGGAP